MLYSIGYSQQRHRMGTIAAMQTEDHGRGERIRTSGLYVPNVALYQAKLHPAVAIVPWIDAKKGHLNGVAQAIAPPILANLMCTDWLAVALPLSWRAALRQKLRSG